MHFASRLAARWGWLAVSAWCGLAALPAPTLATQVPGGGPAKTDCYSTFDVRGATISGKTVNCKAGDPNCNANSTTCNATATSCTFEVRQCIKQTIAGCTPPGSILSNKTKPPLSAVTVTGGTAKCGEYAKITVPLKKNGTKPGKSKITLVAKSDAKPKVDKDQATLQCDPPATSGCKDVVCGDAILSAKEACDPAATPTGCSGSLVCNNACACVPSICGDRKKTGTEDCDDGITQAGQCPAGKTCSNCACVSGCGDGVKSSDEACDDSVTPTGCGAGEVCAACTCQPACPQVASGVPTRLKLNQQVGTANCGLAGLVQHCATNAADPNDPDDGKPCTSNADCGAFLCLPSTAVVAAAPFGGAVYNGPDPNTSTKLADLGLGCLYLGNGGNTSTNPSINPDGSQLFLTPTCPNGAGLTNITLKASAGTTLLKDCSFGSATVKKCQNGSPGTGAGICTTDTDCGVDGACQPQPNCFFGPPLPIPNGAVSTCVLNAIKQDIGGTMDATTGDVTTTIPLTSLVFLTGTTYGEPCPVCQAGTCNFGPNQGKACTAVGSKATTVDCPPDGNKYIGPIPVTLAGITTGSQTKSDADGFFCKPEGQSRICLCDLQNPGACAHNGDFCVTDADCGGEPLACTVLKEPGAFGHPRVRSVVSQGSAAGDTTDGLVHSLQVAGAFCIPASGNGIIDSAAALPGPGQTSLKYDAQLVP